VDSKVTRLTSLIEPMLIIFTGIVIGAILVVIYLPVFYLGLAIKRGMQ
jgi:type IV pilus assembly protein PilC